MEQTFLSILFFLQQKISTITSSCSSWLRNFINMPEIHRDQLFTLNPLWFYEYGIIMEYKSIQNISSWNAPNFWEIKKIGLKQPCRKYIQIQIFHCLDEKFHEYFDNLIIYNMGLVKFSWQLGNMAELTFNFNP